MKIGLIVKSKRNGSHRQVDVRFKNIFDDKKSCLSKGMTICLLMLVRWMLKINMI